MNEDNNNQNDQHTEEQQPSDETQTELREISEEELKKILEEHQKWLESDGKEGEKADLSRANLQKADLSEANLQKANLSATKLENAFFIRTNLQHAFLALSNLQNADLEGVHLQNAYLRFVNLQNAFLYEANLQNVDLLRANLQETNLSGADLQKADLSEANLQGADLDAANLSDASLYKVNMQNTVLDDVKGLSTAEIQYVNLVGATGLLGNEFAQADVTGTKLPDDIKDFKALETVRETSQNARKIFFAMLLCCVYSWLTIATTTDVRLLTNTASSPLPIIQTEIPIVGFYWAAPLVLMCLYFYFHLYLLKLWETLASLPAIFPDGKRLDERAYPWLLNGLVRRHFKRLKTGRPFIAHIQEWITIFLAWCVVPFTIMAFWLRYIPRHDWLGTCFHIGLIVVSVAFAIIFYRLCALTLQRKEKVAFHVRKLFTDRRFYYGVSVVVVAVLFSLLSYGSIEGNRPIIFYSGMDYGEIEIHSVKEIIPRIFKKVGYDVFAEFREKSVSEKPTNYWEIIKEERLESVKGANLNGINLKNANIYNAFLVKADLRNANLENAFLDNSNLQNAQLKKANLRNTQIAGANLLKANLIEADLENSLLMGTNFSDAKMNKANLNKAKVDSANFKNTDLTGSNLQNASFKWAVLSGSNLAGANLQKADLYKSDLTGIKNLKIEQLSKVKTLYKAKLDPELLEQVQKCCPHLLKRPKLGEDKTN